MRIEVPVPKIPSFLEKRPVHQSRSHMAKMRRAARRHWIEFDDCPGGHYAGDLVDIMRRQGYRCFHCGFGGRKLYRTRIVPPNRGGTNNVGNLFALCFICKSWKHGKTYAEFRYLVAKADLKRQRGEFKTQGRALPVRQHRRFLALAVERGFMREPGVEYLPTDPDACTCTRGQAPHRLGSVVCKEAS